MNCVMKKFVIFCFMAVLTKNVYTPVLVESSQKVPLRSAYTVQNVNL